MNISNLKENRRFSYRKAEPRDIETLTELLCELYGNLDYDELYAENKVYLANGKQAFFLAYNGETPIGVCHVALRSEYVNGKVYDGTAGYLEAVYVRPAFRLLGIAANLVTMCEEWSRQNGCKEFLSDCLLDNIESYKFHLKIGFAETERCIFFRKELK